MSAKYTPPQEHSSAWIFQTWASFILAVGATAIGVFYLPVNLWIKAYLSMGLLFTVGSCFSLSKTLRDIHENKKVVARIDEVKLQKLLAEHDLTKE